MEEVGCPVVKTGGEVGAWMEVLVGKKTNTRRKSKKRSGLKIQLYLIDLQVAVVNGDCR